MKNLVGLPLSVLFVAFTYSIPANAQAVYGSIVGTVTDPNGGVLTGAKITITDTGRDVSANTTANDS